MSDPVEPDFAHTDAVEPVSVEPIPVEPTVTENTPTDAIPVEKHSSHDRFSTNFSIAGRHSGVDHYEHHLTSFAHHGNGQPCGYPEIPPESLPVLPFFIVQPPPAPKAKRESHPKIAPAPVDTVEDPRTKDPFLRTFDELKAKIYLKYPVEVVEVGKPIGFDESTDEPSDGGPPKLTLRKPDESAPDDLSAYIQNQLNGNDAGTANLKTARTQLVPIPLRYRRPLKAKSREELEPLFKPAQNENPSLFDFTFPDENPLKDTRLLNEFMGKGGHLHPLRELKHSCDTPAVSDEGELAKGQQKMGGHFQRIFPEDPTWKLGIIERLSEICLQTILVRTISRHNMKNVAEDESNFR